MVIGHWPSNGWLLDGALLCLLSQVGFVFLFVLRFGNFLGAWLRDYG